MTPLPLGQPRFVTKEEALAWHEISIVQYGGSSGIRDLGALESALAQPKQRFGEEYAHAFPFGMAAAYAFFVAKNHPFVDGNKRTALMCCGGFLRMNGWNLASDGEEAADAILALVTDEVDRDAFASWLEAHCRARPSMELRDFLASVDLATFVERLGSFAAKQSEIELQRSTDEAGQTIPLVKGLDRLAEREEGEAAQAALRGATIVLVALYRIAEDMGYEW